MGRIRRNRKWQPSVIYIYVRSRQLEGTLSEGPEIGTYIISASRVLAGWGVVSETKWPYPKAGQWPVNEPKDLDSIAKYNRIFAYFRIRSLEDARNCLTNGSPFTFCVPTHSGWKNPPNGTIPLPVLEYTPGENHTVVAVGLNDEKRHLIFRNSWGKTWGDDGYGYLPYEYFERHMREAWSLQPPFVQLKRQSGVGYVDHFQINKLGYSCTIHDAWDFAREIRVGWCFGTERDGYLDVEEFFVRPDYRRKGIGRNLLRRLAKVADGSGLPLRFWIPYCDVKGKTAETPAIDCLLEKENGYVVSASGVSWALYKAQRLPKPESAYKSKVLQSEVAEQNPPGASLGIDFGVGEIMPNKE